MSFQTPTKASIIHVSGLDNGGKDARTVCVDSKQLAVLDEKSAVIAAIDVLQIKNARVERIKVGGLIKKFVPALIVDYAPDPGKKKQLILQSAEKSDLPVQWICKRIEKDALIRSKHAVFEQRLAEIPRAEVGTDGEKGAVRNSAEFINGLKISNISAKTPHYSLADFVAVDIETCGLSVKDPVIEISAIRFEGFKPVEVFSSFLDPGKSIPADAAVVNGITDDMVKGMPTIWNVIPSFCRFVSADPIVGHNVAFDFKFLYRYGFDLRPKQKVYDTYKLATKYFKKDEISDYSLGSCCEEFGLLFPQHRAAGDALATGFLFCRLAERLSGD